LAAFCAFGKLPSHGDFVSVGPRSEPFVRFDEWLTRGVEWAQVRSGAPFCNAFRSGGARAFVYRGEARAREQALLVGALAPSQDEAGRLFPLCVAASVVFATEFSQNPHLVPFACESIWQIAGQCVADLGLNPNAAVAEQISGLPQPARVQFSDAEADYLAWGEALPFSELCSLVTGSGQNQLFGSTLRLLIGALPHDRTALSVDTPLSLRLPLGAAGGAAVCFWLDAVRRLGGPQQAIPSIFWSHDGCVGHLTVHLGVAPVASISELWLPTQQRDEFCDLTLPPAAAVLELLPPLPREIERVLSTPAGSVGDLLAALEARG
jgi:type VI secretion system ImpM family protein